MFAIVHDRLLSHSYLCLSTESMACIGIAIPAREVTTGYIEAHTGKLDTPHGIGYTLCIAGVLKAFGKQGLLGITNLANATGLSKSTTHRLVTALVVVGQQERRVNARPLVTGAPVYASEFEQPNMLHARILHSPHAHANILRIVTSRALALPGRGG